MDDEQRFFDLVAEEIAQNQYDRGLMARAVADSLGDEKLAQSLYINLRVHTLKLLEAQALAEEQRVRKKEPLATEASEKNRDHPYYCVECGRVKRSYYYFESDDRVCVECRPPKVTSEGEVG